MRILFMGTPDFASECLKKVYSHPEAEIVGAVTQPDKPKGRGMKMIAPPVKVFAEEMGIPVYQPATLKDGTFEDELKDLDPELIIVAAYGKILPNYIIDYPKYGCINPHASVLPRHRGAAPINRAIMEGDSITGVTAIYIDSGIDTGDMILKLETEITDDDDAGTLHDRLAEMGGEAMCRTIDMILSGSVMRTAQSDDGATYAAKIMKEDCKADFNRSARDVFNFIRGLSPYPGAITKTQDGKLLKLTGAHMSDKNNGGAVPGTVISLDGAICVSCGDGVVEITAVIPEGKGRMSAADYIRGRKISVGDVLSI